MIWPILIRYLYAFMAGYYVAIGSLFAFVLIFVMVCLVLLDVVQYMR